MYGGNEVTDDMTLDAVKVQAGSNCVDIDGREKITVNVK